jgi:hypothetical protein
MKYTIFYRDLTNEYRAEKTSFSFGAFIFGWIWLAVNGLWLRAVWGLTLYLLSILFPYIRLVMTSFPDQISAENIKKITVFVINNTDLVDPTDFTKSGILILLTMIYVGTLGRHWLKNKFRNAGFSELGKQSGLNKEDAVTVAQAKLEKHFLNNSDNIEDEWSFRKRLDKTTPSPLQDDTFDPAIVVWPLICIAYILLGL